MDKLFVYRILLLELRVVNYVHMHVYVFKPSTGIAASQAHSSRPVVHTLQMCKKYRRRNVAHLYSTSALMQTL